MWMIQINEITVIKLKNSENPNATKTNSFNLSNLYFIFVHLFESKCHSILQRKDPNIPFFFSEWPPKGIPYNRRVNANKVTKEKKKKTQNKVVETLFTFGKLFLWIFPLFKFFFVVSFSSVIQCKPELLTCLFDNDMYSMERTFLYNKIKKNGSFHCATRYMLENDEVYLKKK